MIIGVAAGSVFANMTYQANYYFLADLNMDVSSIKQMDDASMVNYTMYILGKRIFQILLANRDQRRGNRAVSDVSAMDLLRGGDMLVGKERKGQGQQRTVSILSRFCRTCHRRYDQ